MKRLKADNRGVTLVEIMVALLILSIVVGLAGSMLLSSSNFFRKTSEANLDKLAADGIYQILSDELIYATALSVNQPLSGEAKIIQVQNGRLLLNGTDMLTDEAYHGRNLRLEISQQGQSMELFIVLLDRQGEEVYRAGASMKLLNLEVQQTTVTGDASAINPALYYLSPKS